MNARSSRWSIGMKHQSHGKCAQLFCPNECVIVCNIRQTPNDELKKCGVRWKIKKNESKINQFIWSARIIAFFRIFSPRFFFVTFSSFLFDLFTKYLFELFAENIAWMPLCCYLIVIVTLWIIYWFSFLLMDFIPFWCLVLMHAQQFNFGCASFSVQHSTLHAHTEISSNEMERIETTQKQNR